jgi:hypothetical protein
MTSKTTYHVMEVSDESASEFPENYNWDSERSQSAFRNYMGENKTFPEYEPFLEQELYPDREFNKRNDFIFGPIERYCVSEKTKNILEGFKLPNHKFFKVTVYRTFLLLGLLKLRTKLNKRYYAFFYDFIRLDDSLNWIDFDKTIIYAKTGRNEKIKLNIKNADEFRQIPIRNGQLSKRLTEITDFDDPNFKSLKGFESEYNDIRNAQLGHFESERIYFNKNFDHAIDLFEIPYFSWMTYISDRMADKFKTNNVSGLIISKPGERQYKVKRPNPELVWDND